MAIEFQPYVGPRPFELKDKNIFFGRDQEARDLLSLVIAHNVVLVYAQSGAGKTSLLNARLIPMLKENRFEIFPVARVKGMLAGKIEYEEITNIFVFNTLMNWVENEKVIDVKSLSQMTLTNFLNERKHPIDETGLELPRAIIFDQFEELFSLYQDRWRDRVGFFEQIRDALEKDKLLRMVFIMREDYIAQFEPYANFLPEKLRTRFRIERLNRDAALLAIKEPLKGTGRYFAKGVAEKLVDDLLKIRVEIIPGEITEVAGEFIETVQLQVICQNLWQELPQNVMEINIQHLETYGNVERALSRFYDEALWATVRVSRIDERRLRKWCEEELITAMKTRGMVYRAPESTGGIPNTAVDILESKHLIRGEVRAGARWYELTHDTLIEPILSSNAHQAIINAKEQSSIGNYDAAIEYYQKALSVYTDISDSHRATMGRKGIILVTIYFILFSTFFLYGFMLIWPSLNNADFDLQVTFLGRYAISAETRFLLMVALFGALGGFMSSLNSFVYYLSRRALMWSLVSVLILLPFIGATLGLVFYLIIRGAFLSPYATAEQISPSGFVIVAFLAGMFSKPVVLKLREVAVKVAVTLLSKAI